MYSNTQGTVGDMLRNANTHRNQAVEMDRATAITGFRFRVLNTLVGQREQTEAYIATIAFDFALSPDVADEVIDGLIDEGRIASTATDGGRFGIIASLRGTTPAERAAAEGANASAASAAL